MEDKPEDGTVSVVFLCQKQEFTIDFIAKTASLSGQWVASVSCGTSEMKTDSVLSFKEINPVKQDTRFIPKNNEVGSWKVCKK